MPGQDITSVYPGKKRVQDMSPILLERIRLFEGYADASSGVTSGFTPSASSGRNATGLCIALSAAAEGHRGTIKRLDDEIIEPLIERAYRWIMEYGYPDLPKAPATVRAVSTAATQAGELRSRQLMELLSLINCPLSSLAAKKQ